MLTSIMAILLLGALGGPSLAPPADRADIRRAERIEGLKGLSDVALVAPGLYRGGTPREGGMDALSKLGVRTIVNLRHFHKRTEGALAEKAGIKYIWLPIPSSGEPSDETLQRFLAIVQDREAQPVYVHCYRGKDRTGTMIAAYRILIEGWTTKDALGEMQEFGFFDGWVKLRRWVERLTERSAAAGQPSR